MFSGEPQVAPDALELVLDELGVRSRLLAIERVGFRTVIATGGIVNGLDAARAIVLGASAVGIARPVLQAFAAGGRQAALEYLMQVEQELRTAFLLMGAGSVAEAQRAPRLLTGPLADWRAHLDGAR